MKETTWKALLIGTVVLPMCLVVGCGGNNTTTTAPQAAEISIAPQTMNVSVSQTTQFTANVANASGTVNWSVAGVAGGNATVGLISSTGLYTAPAVPPSPNTVTIEAALASDSSVNASAMVTVTNPAPQATSLSPAAINPTSGGASLTPVTISGTGFAAQSTVTAGSSPVATTFVSSTELTAIVPGTLTAASGLVSLTVTTPGPGGGASSSLTLTVIASGAVASTNNPQVAQYSLSPPQNANVIVEFGPDTNYGFNTSSFTAPSGGGTMNMLVAGMKAFTTYHMRAVATFPDGSQYTDADHTFTTGGLDPTRLPQISVTQTPGLTPNPGIEMLDLVLGNANALEVAAVDLQGNVIWYYDLINQPGYQTGMVVNPIKVLPNGNILMVISNPALPLSPEVSMIREIDLAGNMIWQITNTDLTAKLAAAGYNITVQQIHHDFALLPNGHMVFIANTAEYFNNLIDYPPGQVVVGDILVDLDPNLNVSWVWNAFDHTDVLSLNRHLMGLPDWMHSNALIYSPTDGNLVLSIRHQSWIIKIDYRNGTGAGNIVWKLGWQGDFKLLNGTDPIDWFYAQHYVNLPTPQSAGIYELGLFDNGNLRVTDSNGDVCGTPGQIACYSSAPIFRINELSKTANILFRDTLPIFSFFAGNEQVLSNGDVEFDEAASFPGAGFFGPYQTTMMEVTQQGTPQTVWQLTISGQDAYRALRVPSLYAGVTW